LTYLSPCSLRIHFENWNLFLVHIF
jgi:hypothetical protein